MLFTRKISIIILIVALSSASSILNAQQIYPDYHDGQLYVVVERNYLDTAGYSPDFLNKITSEVNITLVEQPFTYDSDTLTRTWLLKFAPAEKVDKLMRELNSMVEVEFAERVPLTRVFLTPNDPLYSSTAYGYDWNWYLDIINAEGAWDISTGSSNVKLAIVDNAVYTEHPDLKNKIILEKDLSDGDNNADPPAGGSDYTKYIWSHGTHCAGLAAAETNNGTGIAGIGYNVSLIAVKTAPDTSSGHYTYNGIAGVQWAAQKGADVISASWGGTGYSAVNENFYQSLKNVGIMVVAAAGNEGAGSNAKNYPAAYNAVIAVGSTNADDERSGFSQYGNWLDVSAPGGYYPSESSVYKISMLSTTYNNTYVVQGIITGKYDINQGTSMSTPVVAGLLGLMKAASPTASYSELKSCLTQGCDEIDSKNLPEFTGKMGIGRINAEKSLQCITGTSVAGFEEDDLVIFPNPSEGEVLIRNLDTGTYHLSIFDATGRSVFDNHMEIRLINLSYLPSGVYLFRITTENNTFTKKIIIQRSNN